MSGSQLFVPVIGHLLSAVLAVSAPSPHGSTMSVRTITPVACSADVSFSVVRFTPLVIDATVHQKCNTPHQLTVTYQPVNLSNPERLRIRMGGQAPNVSGPGSASFTGLPFTDSVSHLRIAYMGPRNERQQLIDTVSIGVSY